MSQREEALRALEQTTWSESDLVEEPPRPATAVFAARLPEDLGAALVAEAKRRGVKPGRLIRTFIEQGLAASGDSETVTVRLDRLRAPALAAAADFSPVLSTGREDGPGEA